MSIGGAGRGSLGLGSPADLAPIFIAVAPNTLSVSSVAPAVTLGNDIPITSVALALTPNTPTIVIGGPIPMLSGNIVLSSTAPVVTAPEILQVSSNTILLSASTITASGGEPRVNASSTALTLNSGFIDILLSSDLLERTVNVACTDQVFILLATIDHPSLSTPVRISNDPTQILPVAQVRGTLSNGSEYVYLPFDFIFPNQESDVSPVAKIQIDNISREIATVIDGISTSPTFKIQVALSSTPDIIELELTDFTLRKVDWTASQITADITVESFDQEPYPAGRFNPSSFPALFAN